MDVGSVVAIVLTGIFVVLPIVALLTYHRRKMVELSLRKHGNPEGQNEVMQRLDSIQSELRELRDRQNELILQQHDQLPPSSPKVEDRIRE